MPRSVALFALLLAGCSSSSSSPDPRVEKDLNWGNRQPVRREPAPEAKELQPTPLPSTPVQPTK